MDELTSASIAGKVAEVVDLPVATKVIEHSISIEVQGLVAAYNSASGDLSDKPQLITSSDDSRITTTHTVVAGETLQAIASRYGVSVDTIKWANNLTSESVSVGKKLKILPTSGALYKVKEGDTLASLASKYKVTQQRIVLFNDLELTGLKVGSEIVLPNAELPANERPGYVAPYTRFYTSYDYAIGGSRGHGVRILSQGEAISKYIPRVKDFYQRSNGKFGSNTMTLGQCTWYVWERRAQLGRDLKSGQLGDAGWWSPYSTGMTVVRDVHRELKQGDVMQRFGSPGHVSVVERVTRDDNGRITEIMVSEMNSGVRTQYYRGGMSAYVNERTYSGSVLGMYRFLK